MYHIYKRSIPRGKKKIKAYYYWYWDDRGKRTIRSCGTGGKPCLRRSEAEAFIRALPQKLPKSHVAIENVARKMFLLGSPHMDRRMQMGRHLSKNTRLQFRSYIDRIILPLFGSLKLEQQSVTAIVDWLLEQPRSSSWKNEVLTITQEIFREAKRLQLVTTLPTFERFSDDSVRQSVLSTEEIERLFARESQEKIWGPEDAEVFYTFFLLCLSAGLRLGEARAFRPCQFFPEKQAVVIDRFLKQDGTPTLHLKKGTKDDPRIRVVLIPERTCADLTAYIEKRKPNPQDLLFQEKGLHILSNRAALLFARALARAGISTEGRKITPHALRYTYVTRIRRLTDTETVMQMAGHRSIAMADHYTRVEALETATELSTHLGNVNRFFQR